MRRLTVYRLIKRSIFILPLVWLIYSVQEFAFRQNTSNNEIYKLAPNEDVDIVGAQNGHRVLEFGNVHLESKDADPIKDIKSNVHYGEVMRTTSKQGDENRDDLLGKESHHTNTNSQQLDKLAEMGGVLVEKNPQEAYANVVLPTFNSRTDLSGPGEMGRPVSVVKDKLSQEEANLYQQGWEWNSFNQYASDMMSVHRNLPDGRSQACKRQASAYSNQRQEISVIIIFHNEAWSVLLRSVHSILSRTAENILREIILVDDYSTKEHLKEPLEKYFNSFPKVRLVRAVKRQGLTRARLLGYFVSSSPIVVFLDSHIECFPGWAEPLISRISQDPTRVVFPSIEVINAENLQTSCNSNVNQYGIFSFKDLTFQWRSIPRSEVDRRKDDADPIRSPTMPGGLFAISREFFDRLGTYDPQLDYWGGENIELSFKAWMCGGSVELVTCSHIGHIFRHKNPIKWMHNIGSKNSVRVAEVWMDDYKNYFYERILYNLGNYGEVAERKSLRERLQCHSFEWYVNNVYPEADMPVKIKYAGEIRSVATPRCVDSMGGPEQKQPSPKMYQCHSQGYNQFWYLSESGHIFQDQWNICVSGGNIVSKVNCETAGPVWSYREDKTLLHVPSQLCLTAAVTSDDINLTACSDRNPHQRWELQPRRRSVKFPQ